ARQDWAAAQMREWYLFPETLPTMLNPGAYSSVQDYIDALTATARAQGKDRYFTYLTSIAEENAYYASGSSAGFGVRLGYDSSASRAFVIEAFENAPALAAGLDRGTEITAIGTSASTLVPVGQLFAQGGAQAVSDALGPNTVGTTRTLSVVTAGVAKTVTVSKTDYALTPVSSRYGAKVLTDNGIKVGYVNLRTFISTADPALRDAFAKFKAAGITRVIVDVRYNGGGLISISELFDNLLGAQRSTSDVLNYTVFRPEKSSNNQTAFFAPQPQSIAPTKIAFIGTYGTASASELTLNAQIPYLHANVGLIGTNTYGKPVGQIALDNAACDDRLRVIALKTQNAARQGDYYNGLIGTVEASCQAADDIFFPMGDPREASTRSALDFVEGKSCTPIAAGVASAGASSKRILLTPDNPSTAQRETPGLY
ncbi:MAG: S41 family peptidase, partial [Sphingomonas bacterium]|nr:S41 family peptidase [Sphingomonas bacterium]